MSTPVKISRADYDRLKSQGYFKDYEENQVSKRVVDRLEEMGHIDEPKPITFGDEIQTQVKEEPTPVQEKTKPKTKEQVEEDKGLIAYGIEAIGQGLGTFNQKMKEAAPLAGPTAANSYGVIANTLTMGIPNVISPAYALGKGLVTMAKALNPVPTVDGTEARVKAVDFSKTVGELLLNTIGGIKPYIGQKIGELTGNAGAVAANQMQQNQIENETNALFWDKDQTNKFAEGLVSDEIFNALQEAQKNAEYKFDKPEGYEEMAAKEYLNPFTEAGFYTYMQGLPSVGFTLASMGVTTGLTAMGEGLGGKLASIGIKDAIKKKTRQAIGAQVGAKTGYVTSLVLNVDNEARIETYDTYKTLFDKQLEKYTKELIDQGVPKNLAEKQVLDTRYKEMRERSLKSATNVYVNNAVWLLTTQHLQNSLLGVAPKTPGYLGELSELTKTAQSKYSRLFNHPVSRVIASGISEGPIEEGYQTGLQIYERNHVFEPAEGPSYVHGLANGIKDGILNYNDQEAIVSKAMGFITSAPITAIQERKEANHYNKLKEEYNASIQYINAMRNTAAFKIDDNLAQPTFGNINIKGLEHIVKTEDLLTLQAHSEIAKLKQQPNATIYHHALGDMAEDEVLQNRLFKLLEETDSPTPVATLLEDYKREVAASGNNEFYYEGTKMDMPQMIKRKQATLEQTHAAWLQAKLLSSGKDNAGVFRHAFVTRANRWTAQLTYRDQARAEANKLEASTAPHEQALRGKYVNMANTFELEAQRYEKELNAVAGSITAYQAEQVAVTAMQTTATPQEAVEAVPQLTEDQQVHDIAIDNIIHTISETPVDNEQLKSIYEKATSYPELLETADENNIDPEIISEFLNKKIQDYKDTAQHPVYDSTNRTLSLDKTPDPFIASYVEKKFNNALKKPETASKLAESIKVAGITPEDKEHLLLQLDNKTVSANDIQTLLNAHTGTDKNNTPTVLADKILLGALHPNAISLDAANLTIAHLTEVLETVDATGVDPRVVTEELEADYELTPETEEIIEEHQAHFNAQHTILTPELLVSRINYLEAAQQAKDGYVSNSSYYIKDGLHWKRITSITGLEDREAIDPTDKSSDRYHAINIGNMVDIIGKAAFVSASNPEMVSNALFGKHVKWTNTNGKIQSISVIDALTQLKGHDERKLEETDIYEQYLGEANSVFSYMANYAKVEVTKGYIFFPNVFQTKTFKEVLEQNDITIPGYAGEADVIGINSITGHVHVIDIKTSAKPSPTIDILYQRQLALNAEPLFENNVAERANTDLSIIHFELTPSEPTNRHIRTLTKPQVLTMNQKQKQDVYNSISELANTEYSEEPIKEALSTEVIDLFDGIVTPVHYSIPVQLPNLAVNSITMPSQDTAWFTKALKDKSKISDAEAIKLGKQLLSYDNKDSDKTNVALVPDWQALELFRRYEFQIMMNQGRIDPKDMGMTVGGTNYITDLLGNSRFTQKRYLENLWNNLPIDINWQGHKIAAILSTAKDFSNSVLFIKDTAFDKNEQATNDNLRLPLIQTRKLLLKQLMAPYVQAITDIDLNTIDPNKPEFYGEILWIALNGNNINQKKAAIQFIESLAVKRPVTLRSNEGPKGITGFMPIIEAQRKLPPFTAKTDTAPAKGAATGNFVSLKNNPLFETIFNSDIPYTVTNYGKTATFTINAIDFREGNHAVDYKKDVRKHNKIAIKTQNAKRPIQIDLNKTTISNVPEINKVIDYIESHPELDDAIKLKALQTIYFSKATLEDLKDLAKVRKSLINIHVINENNILFPEVVNGKLEFNDYTTQEYIKHLIDLDVFTSDINPWVFENITIGYGNMLTPSNDIQTHAEDVLLKVTDEELGGVRDEASVSKWFKERFEEFTREVLPESEIRDILNIRGFGHKVWGATRDAMVYIANGAPDWVTRHEAMHLVQLTMLSPEQYQDILNEGAERYGITRSNTARIDVGYSISKLKEEANAKGLTAEEFYDSLPGDIKIFEAMADEFGHLIKTQQEPTTVGGWIGHWFERLYNLLFKNNYLRLKNYITDRITIDELFYQVDANIFGRGITDERLAAVTNTINQNKNYKTDSVLSVADWTSQKITQEINYINRDIIGRILDEAELNSLAEYLNTNALTSKTLKSLYNEVRNTYPDEILDKLEKDIAALEDTSNDQAIILERINALYDTKILRELESDLRAFQVGSSEYNDLSNVIDNYKNNKNFRYNLYRDLSHSHRYIVKADLAEEIIEDPENEDINSEIDANEDENADTKVKEKWQVDQTRENPLKFGTLANFNISNIPKVIKHINAADLDGTQFNDPRKHKLIQRKYQVTPRGNYVYDDINERERVLLHELGGILNRQEMMERLVGLTKRYPWINILNHRLNSNSALATEMFIKYSNRYKIDYYKIDHRNGASNNFILNDSETSTYYVRAILNGIQSSLNNTKVQGTTFEIKQRVITLNNSVALMFTKYKEALGEYRVVPVSEISKYNNNGESVAGAIYKRKWFLINSLANAYNAMGLNISKDQINSEYETYMLTHDDAMGNGELFFQNLVGHSNLTGITYLLDFYKESAIRGRIPNIGDNLKDPSLKLAAQSIMPYIKPERLDMFIDSKGNKVSSYSYPMYGSRLFKALQANTKKAQQYTRSVFGKNNPLLKQIKQGLIKHVLLHEYTGEDQFGSTSSLSFDELKHIDLSLYLLSAWSTGTEVKGEQQKISHYTNKPIWLGAKSDSALGWAITAPALDKVTILHNSVKLIQAVITNIQLEQEEGIKQNTKAPQYYKDIIESLKKDDTLTSITADELYKALEVYYDKEVESFIKNLYQSQLFKQPGATKIGVTTAMGLGYDLTKEDIESAQVIVEDVEKFRNIVTDFIYNNSYYFTAYNQLLLQSLSDFKDDADLAKRQNTDTRTGTFNNELTTYSSNAPLANHYDADGGSIIFLNDNVSDNTSFVEKLLNTFPADSPEYNDLTDSNSTDNMGWHTLAYRRQQEINAGTWNSTPDKELYFNHEQRNRGKVSRYKPNFEVFKPRWISADIRNRDMLYHTDVKNAETILSRQYAYKEKNSEYWSVPTANDVADQYSKYESAPLAFLLHLMETRGAQKLTFGGAKINKQAHKLNDVILLDGTLNVDLLNSQETIVLDESDYMIQTAIPNKYKEKNISGIQQINMLYSAVDTQAEYTHPVTNQSISGDAVIDLLEKVQSTLFRKGTEQVIAKTSDLNDISKSVYNNSQIGSHNPEYYDVLSTVSQNGVTSFKTVPYHPSIANFVSSTLQSMFEKPKIQKIEGFVGNLQGNLDDPGLEYIVKDDKAQEAQLAMTYYSSAINEYAKANKLQYEEAFAKLLKDSSKDEMFTGVTYRIPTEAMYSIFKSRVTKPLPFALGGSVKGPMLYMKIAGMDGDSDKIYSAMYVLEYNKNTNELFINYDENTENGLHNIKVNLAKQIYGTEAITKEGLSIGGTKDFLAAREALNLKLKLNPLSFVDNIKSFSYVQDSQDIISISAASQSINNYLSNNLDQMAITHAIGLGDTILTNIKSSVKGRRFNSSAIAAGTDVTKTPTLNYELGLNSETIAPALHMGYLLGHTDMTQQELTNYIVKFMTHPIIRQYADEMPTYEAQIKEYRKALIKAMELDLFPALSRKERLDIRSKVLTRSLNIDEIKNTKEISYVILLKYIALKDDATYKTSVDTLIRAMNNKKISTSGTVANEIATWQKVYKEANEYDALAALGSKKKYTYKSRINYSKNNKTILPEIGIANNTLVIYKNSPLPRVAAYVDLLKAKVNTLSEHILMMRPDALNFVHEITKHLGKDSLTKKELKYINEGVINYIYARSIFSGSEYSKTNQKSRLLRIRKAYEEVMQYMLAVPEYINNLPNIDLENIEKIRPLVKSVFIKETENFDNNGVKQDSDYVVMFRKIIDPSNTLENYRHIFKWIKEDLPDTTIINQRFKEFANSLEDYIVGHWGLHYKGGNPARLLPLSTLTTERYNETIKKVVDNELDFYDEDITHLYSKKRLWQFLVMNNSNLAQYIHPNDIIPVGNIAGPHIQAYEMIKDGISQGKPTKDVTPKALAKDDEVIFLNPNSSAYIKETTRNNIDPTILKTEQYIAPRYIKYKGRVYEASPVTGLYLQLPKRGNGDIFEIYQSDLYKNKWTNHLATRLVLPESNYKSILDIILSNDNFKEQVNGWKDKYDENSDPLAKISKIQDVIIYGKNSPGVNSITDSEALYNEYESIASSEPLMSKEEFMKASEEEQKIIIKCRKK